MNRNYRARPPRDDRTLDSSWINQQSFRIDIHQCNANPSIKWSGGTCDEGEIWHDCFAAIVQSVMIERSCERNTQRIRTVSHQNRVFGLTICRPLFRELSN